MKRTLSSHVLPALMAGLLFGSATRVFAANPADVPVGSVQPEATLYALTLVDAKNVINGEYQPITEQTTAYKVCLTVSVPRNNTTAPSITVNAVPATLMYRPHNGSSGTTWSGSIFMTAEGNGYYPMPQTGTINRTPVASGSKIPNTTTNLEPGSWRNPARWERRFYSNELTLDNKLIASLVSGEATYEWYAASRYGLGFFSVVSDIQDHGRKMDFTDPRLWIGAHVDDDSDNEWDDRAFGVEKYNAYTLASMNGADSSWMLKKTALGVAGSNLADKGALLLQDETIDYIDFSNLDEANIINLLEACPSITSPRYPDGVSQVSFMVKAGIEADVLEDNPQYLYIQACQGSNGAWSSEGITVSMDGGKPFTQYLKTGALIQPTTALSKVVVTMDETIAGRAQADTQFRILRVSSYEGVVAAATSLPLCIRELRVRSATPSATFAEPYVTRLVNGASVIAPAMEDQPFAVNFKVTPDTTRPPRGYDATLKLARRVESDKTRSTYEVALTEMASTTATTLVANFEPIGEKYTLDYLGENNLSENAFYQTKGNVTGLLAGIYDMTLNCGLLGSFEAGRTSIDGRESTDHILSVMAPPVDDPDKVMRPFILDVREAATQAQKVELVINYRTNALDDKNQIAPVIKQTVAEMVPQGLTDKTWTIDLPKSLLVDRDGHYLAASFAADKDPDAEYIWCASSNETGPYDADAGIISFQLRLTTQHATTGESIVYWFGQNEVVAEGQTPTMIDVYPGSTFATGNGVEDGAQTAFFPAPVLVDTKDNQASHITVTFVEGDGVATPGSIAINGTYAQDFNTWDSISNGRFADSDFRENVRWAVADFDATMTHNGERAIIASGWLPDQGPLAETTEYYDQFVAGRRYSNHQNAESEYNFFVRALEDQASNSFASWGASHELADISLLRWTEGSATSLKTDFFQFGSDGTPELVINRDVNDMHETTANGWLPDLLVRLSSSPHLQPNASLGLSGIGTVSFNLSRSEPYDITHIYRFAEKRVILEEAPAYTGLQATVSVTRHAKSGYSVSLYLINSSEALYEFRLSQVLDLSANTDDKTKPKECLIAELWSWTSASSTPSPIRLTNGNTYAKITAPTSMHDQSLSLWVGADNRLHAKVGTGTEIVSSSTVSSAYSSLAIGSAECWPTFSTICAANTPAATPAFNPLTSGLYVGANTTSSEMWTRTSADTSTLVLQRKPLSAADVAQLEIIGYNATTSEREILGTILCKDTDAKTPVTLTIGRSDIELQLRAKTGSHLFLDNLRVSSWQGNDALRNGDDYVPEFTDAGWDTSKKNDGFSAVGVWILPTDDTQNTVLPENYRGEQCMLMQYSRRNTASGLGMYEDTVLGVTHTGSTLALYTPYSMEGFGTVSFRYRIPTLSEFKNSTTNPSVSLLLQYCDTTSAQINNLKNPKSNAAWQNVSDVVTLMPTAGEWVTASITPRLPSGAPLLATHTGVLRLVMVAPSTDVDPYLYMDDFRMTSNAGEKALWTAGNSLPSDDPISALYWKDRLPASSTESDFAWYSRLTRGMLFNNSTIADVENGAESPLMRAFIASPVSPRGIGRVAFAARLNDANAVATPIYLYVTEKDADPKFPEDYTLVETFEVKDTVYRTFEVDLAKDQDVPNAQVLRSFYLYIPTEGDGFKDPEGATSRVWIDKLSLSEPVSPTLRISNVAFSTVPGDDFARHLHVPKGAETIYTALDGRNSPLSQPIAGAPLVVKATVDRMQQVKPGTVRVFFTYDKQTHQYVKMTEDAAYSYTDVLGNTVTASQSAPIYTWMPEINDTITEESAKADVPGTQDKMAELASWSLKTWFGGTQTAVMNALSNPDAALRQQAFETFSATQYETSSVKSVELKAAKAYTDADTLLTFTTDDDNIVEITKELTANAMVRYAVWAIFETEDSTVDNPRYGMACLDANAYTEHPWYFPRNFNTEMRARYDRLAQYINVETSTSELFSPYFWVYDTVPGEIFINEFNLSDATNNDAVAMSKFVELCAPVAVSLKGWRVDYSKDSDFTTSETDPITDTADKSALLTPQTGVVPVQRTTGTQANRTFYTLVNQGLGSKIELVAYDANGNKSNVTHEPSQNAGRAQNGGYAVTTSYPDAEAIRLYRPTGGLEHTVLYSRYKANGAQSLSRAEGYLDDLVTRYRTYYKQEKFGSEWFQAFREGGWELYSFDPDAVVDVDGAGATVTVQEAHRARRLAVASYYNGNDNGAYSRETKATSPSFISDCYATTDLNAIATVDMGGVWVMRTNNVDEAEGAEEMPAGPTDLTDLFVNAWPGYNPTEKTRSGATVTPPAAQITPRQINLDQYMLYYADPNGNTLTSSIEGLGQHVAELINADDDVLSTIYGGRTQLHRSIVNASKVKVTYTPLAFNRLTSLTLTITNTKDGIVVNKDNMMVDGASLIDALLAEMAGTYTVDTTDPKVARVVFDVNQTDAPYCVTFATALDALLYSFDFEATFEADASLAKEIIETVQPYCGDTLVGSAKYQPWKGSSFGFSVRYNTEKLADEGARLVGAMITLPTPDNYGLDETAATWTGLLPTTIGTDTLPALTGLTVADASKTLDLMAMEGLCRVATLGATRKLSDAQSEVYGASAVAVLGDSYKNHGVEPVIPYMVWGVYAVTIQVGTETETIEFLLPQEVAANRSPMPAWYRPLSRLATNLPYFYLYSTPPESAWLNELNIAQGTGSAPFAEVVFPVLRQGITNAGVPQPSIEGWKVRCSDGGEWTFGATATATQPATSNSYNFYSIDIAEQTAGAAGYALIRPCGAGEGGVWVGVDAQGGAPIPVDATADMGQWMWVVPGETDATDVTGSIQLVGKTLDGATVPPLVSSRADDRTTWDFCTTETRDKNNEGVGVDGNPEWNRVRITSTLLNVVYGGSPCGYHDFDNLPEATLPIGFGEGESFAGGDWVSMVEKNTLGRYITYRPRAGYTYDYLQLPPEWMGRVILVGQRIEKRTEAFSEVQILDLARNALVASKGYTDPMDKAAALVAMNGFATAERSGNTFTGKILFNGEKPVADDLLFKDTDDYVVAVLLIDEPIAATNELVMGMRPGTVEAGAWLVSQSFYGLKKDNGVWVPDETKAGALATNPIWDDEIGNGEEQYTHRHGWIYQPTVGDTLSMSAVIRPDNGLYSDDVDIVAAMTAEQPTIRPMLIWTVIDKSAVPSNLFTATDTSVDTFLSKWDISNIVNGTPSLRDGISTSFTEIRQEIEKVNAEGAAASKLYVKGGILPMTLRGIRSEDETLAEDFIAKAFLTDDERADLNESDAPYLAYSVMTQAELTDALAVGGSLEMLAGQPTNATDDGMVDLTTELAMINTESSNIWRDGSLLRFAVVLVDVSTGRVLDAQGISNFKSDELPIYCPWYVPEASADVNFVSKAKKYGYAPYAWVYSIGFDEVWINEMRPFMSTSVQSPSSGTAVELAMKASDYTTEGSAADPLYVPNKSLDGWKLVVKYAPIPAIEEITEDTRMAWVRSSEAMPGDPLYGRTIDLKSWIPARRLFAEPADATMLPENYWSLDYYCVASSAEALSKMTATVTAPETKDYLSCLKRGETDRFVYLKTAEETTTGSAPDVPFGDTLISDEKTGTHTIIRHILPDYKALLDTLPASTYKHGLVFGIELVRNNGVVTDEVLFMYKNEEPSLSVKERLDAVIAIEERAFASANKIRAITSTMDLVGDASAMFVDEVEDADGDGLTEETIKDTLWTIAMNANGGLSSFPGANLLTLEYVGGGQLHKYYYKQPNLSYSFDVSRFFSLSATILGGRLGLTEMKSALPQAEVCFKQIVPVMIGGNTKNQEIPLGPQDTSVSLSSLMGGTIYTLYVTPVVDEWFNCTASCNGSEIQPAEVTSETTTVSEGRLVTLKTFAIVKEVALNGDTSYTIELAPTQAVKTLTSDARFSVANNADYEAWLVASGSPDEIEDVLDDKLTLAEKYWLGFEDAITDNGEDVSLAFSQMAQTTMGEGVTLPTLAARLENNGVAITNLRSDGALVLVGKVALTDDAWSFIKELNPATEVNLDEHGADRMLVIDTDHQFFKLLLLSKAKALELKNATP